MGEIIRTTDGRIVGVNPTMDQGDIDRERKAAESANKRREAYEAEENL